MYYINFHITYIKINTISNEGGCEKKSTYLTLLPVNITIINIIITVIIFK
jgi:hypothetical protein